MVEKTFGFFIPTHSCVFPLSQELEALYPHMGFEWLSVSVGKSDVFALPKSSYSAYHTAKAAKEQAAKQEQAQKPLVTNALTTPRPSGPSALAAPPTVASSASAPNGAPNIISPSASSAPVQKGVSGAVKPASAPKPMLNEEYSISDY